MSHSSTTHRFIPRIGIDLGGTKTEIIALDDADRALLRRRVPTPPDDYAAALDMLVRLVAEVEQALGCRASVGVGTPGSLSPATGRMRNANSTCLNGRPLLADLSARLGRDVRFANDANCLAASEAADGAGREVATVFAVILGTGIGGGLVVDGHLLEGANRIAGEWGHNPLAYSDDDRADRVRCYCGRIGCIETRLSGPGMAAEHAARNGPHLTPSEIVTRAAHGDRDSEATLQRYERRLARALASVINIVDPDVIVLGGGLSNMDRLYANVPRLWREHIFSDVVGTRLVRSLHGDSSGVRGAARLWPLAARD